jgi:hypothetical protein
VTKPLELLERSLVCLVADVEPPEPPSRKRIAASPA